MMDPRLERLFQFREEYQLEVDPVLKAQLYRRMCDEIRLFLREQNLHMDELDFNHTTAEAYKHWRRNKH